MCFFIAGVQPKTKTIDTNARRCPQCGLYQAYRQRTDHYISLFFIPLIPISRGKPYLYCQRCDQTVDNGAPYATHQAPAGGPKCSGCGRSMDADFAYCPYCGKKLHSPWR